MKSAYILDAIRTPIGSFGGSLSNLRADDLATVPLIALMRRNPKVDWEQLEDVILGCANQARLHRLVGQNFRLEHAL